MAPSAVETGSARWRQTRLCVLFGDAEQPVEVGALAVLGQPVPLKSSSPRFKPHGDGTVAVVKAVLLGMRARWRGHIFVVTDSPPSQPDVIGAATVWRGRRPFE